MGLAPYYEGPGPLELVTGNNIKNVRKLKLCWNLSTHGFNVEEKTRLDLPSTYTIHYNQCFDYRFDLNPTLSSTIL